MGDAKTVSAQTTFYYNGTSAPDLLTSWGSNADGTGTNPPSFSMGGLTYYFSGANGKTVTLPKTFYAKSSGTKPKATTVIDTLGVNVIVPVGGLDSATTFGVSDTSWLTLQDTMNVKLGTLKPTSTVAYDGAATLNILAGTYGNLISTNDSLATRIIPKRTITIVGNFDEGMATFSDTLSTITYKGTGVQHIAPISYYSLTITNAAGAVIDSGDVVTISGGKLSISTKDSLNILGTLVYASKTAPTLTGFLHVFANGTIQILDNLASIPASATTTYDSASVVMIGDSTNSVTVLPKLALTASPYTVVINTPAITTHTAGLILPKGAGSYVINGDLDIISGNINASSAAKNRSLTINGGLNISGGTYTVCDSTSYNDTLFVMSASNITGGALYVTNNTKLTGKGSLYLYSDFIDTLAPNWAFGTNPASTQGGAVYFKCLDTAGQNFGITGIINDTIAPVDLHSASGNEVEIFSDITLNSPLYCDTGSYTVDAGYHLTLNKGFANYYVHSFVITDALVGYPGQGLLQVNNIPKNAWYTIPLGYDSASAYSPIWVKSADDSISVTVTNYEAISLKGYPDANSPSDTQEINNLVLSTWNFTRNDNGTSPLFFKISWFDSIAQPGVNADTVSSDFTVYAIINNDSTFSEYKPVSVDRPNDSVVIELSGTFKTGYFMIGKKGIKAILPVHFTNVAAELKGDYINVSWKTASEQNMTGYTVERSSDGAHFISVGSVAANDKSTNVYDFKDAGYANGENYYRIKAIDKTGAATYSSIVKVSVSETINKSISIYPNPVIGKVISIALNNQDANLYNVQLVSSNGKIVASKQINHLGGSSVNTFDVSSLNVKGLYFLRITSAEGQTTKTVLIK